MMQKVSLFFLSMVLSLNLSGQVQITTKKGKISDFTTTTTKVVASGNEELDEALKEAMKDVWSITPFEFCTLEEFETLKSSEEYYFMLPRPMKHKGQELGIMELIMVKGGSADNLRDMLHVTSLPLCPADACSGREFSIFAGIVDIFQKNVMAVVEEGGKPIRNVPMHRTAGKTVVLVENELSPDAKSYVESLGLDWLIVTDGNSADSAFDSAEDYIVGYAVIPSEPSQGDESCIMLIDASNYKLCYFATRRIGDDRSEAPGFQKSDIQKILKSR